MIGQLRTLLSAVLASNPFYSAKLRAAGVDDRIAGLPEFSARVPFTVKQELVDDQREHPPYGSNLTFPLEHYTRFCQTSATSGTPMRWLDTAESWEWVLDCWKQIYAAARVGPSDRVFCAFSFGPFLGFWAAFEAATRIGCLAIPGGGMRSAVRLRVMLDNQVTVLCCTPTYAIRLAEVAAEAGIDLSGHCVRTIIVAGEPGGSIPATRSQIETLWPGARVLDHHGMTETGPVSYGCPARPCVLHVIESAYYAEVVDPVTLQPAPPGGAGELILTNLGRIASPLLRYRTGDMVRRAEASPCECGSTALALEGGILGRTDDMLVVRGVNIFPSAVEEVLRSNGPVAEYRVEVRVDRTLPELSIQVEPTLECEDPGQLPRRIEASLLAAFGLRIDVSALPHGTLPRFDGKARRWVRL